MITSTPATLSSSQEDILFHQLRFPDVPMYNIGGYIEFQQVVDVDLLAQCALGLIAQYPGLHVRLQFDEEKAQLLSQMARITFQVYDFSNSNNAEGCAKQFLDAEFARPFMLDSGKLLRVGIIRLAPTRYWYFTIAHHLVIDGWGYANLQRQIFSAYAARLVGNAPEWPEVSVPNPPLLARPGALEFWRDQLSMLPELLFSKMRAPLSEQDVKPVARMVRSLDASWFIDQTGRGRIGTGLPVLLGCLFVALEGLYGRSEMVVGVPVHNRRSVSEKNQVSLAMQVLPLRISSDSGQIFSDLCDNIGRCLRSLYRHTNVSLSRLFREICGEQNQQRVAMFDVVFNYQKLDFDFNDIGLQLNTYFLPNGYEPTPLTLTVCDYGGGSIPQLQVDYATDHFDQHAIERLIEVYFVVLEQALTAEKGTLNQFQLTSSAAREQVLTWGQCGAMQQHEGTVRGSFAAQVARTPDALAVCTAAHHFTYRQLDQKSDCLAAVLQARGTAPGQRVAVILEREAGLIVAFLAILKIGAVYVPLDSAHPAQRLQGLLTDAAPVLVLTNPELASMAGADFPILMLAPDGTTAEYFLDTAFTVPELSAQHPAYMIYTSGSTGRPKGVVVSHANVLSYAAAALARYREAVPERPMRVMQFASVAFDIFIEEISLSLLAGGSLHLRQSGPPPVPAQLWEFVEAHRISAMTLPTAYWHLLCDELTQEHAAIAARHLRLCVVGGEAMRGDAACRWLAHMSTELALFNSYGPTETTVIVAAERILAASPTLPTIGRPLDNSFCYIVDSRGRLLPPGSVGELWIGGGAVAIGYWGRPDLTAKRFRAGPVGAAATRIYRSGDLASWQPDGRLVFHGRIDDQVKISGVRVETGEIAEVIRTFPGIRDAHVGVSEGPGGKQLTGYLVFQTAHTGRANTDALVALLKRELSPQAVPHAFVSLDRLPLTPNGKIDHQALRHFDTAAKESAEGEAAQGSAEQLLAQEWQALLGRPVGRHDNFFSLGGNSLDAMRLVSRMRERGIALRIEDVFKEPSLAMLAANLGTTPLMHEGAARPRIGAGCAKLTPDMIPLAGDLSQSELDSVVASVPGGTANIEDICTLSPQQKGFLFEHVVDPANDKYVLSSILRLPSEEACERVLVALQQVMQRHEALRSLILWEGLSEPIQVVLRSVELPVHRLEGDNILARLRQLAQPGMAAIDLCRAPLLQVHTGLEQADGAVYLLILAHHIIGDHLSQDVLEAEVEATIAGHSLPPPVRYSDFIASLRGQHGQAAEAFFRDLLGDFSAPSLPFGITLTRVNAPRAPMAQLTLTPELASQVRSACLQRGMTPAALFHVAWALVVAKTSGCDDVLFGTVFSGRLRNVAGIERMFGPLLNTLPFRLRTRNLTVAEALLRVHSLLQDLGKHEQASLAEIQRFSQIPSSVQLFSAVLNYVHTRPSSEHYWAVVDRVEQRERNIYPVSMTVEDVGSAFTLFAQCDHRVDAHQLTSLLSTVLQSLVAELATTGESRLDAVSLLAPAESHRQLVEWNATEVAYSREKCLHTLFEEQVQKTPEALAVTFGQQKLTYRELNRRANQLAHYLKTQGVKPDSLVGISIERSIEMVVGLIAILKAGGAYVPLDPSYPPERLAYMIADSAPVVVLVHDQTKLLMSELACEIAVIDVDADRCIWQDLPGHDSEHKDTGVRPSHLAYVIYTSGSTGHPKGVLIEHRSVCNYLSWALSYYAGNRAFDAIVSSPLAFDATITSIYVPLLGGGAMHLVRDGDELAELNSLLRSSQASRIIKITPAHLKVMGEHFLSDRVDCAPQTFVVGGEAFPTDTARIWKAISPESRLINEYGPTETVVGCIIYEADATPPDQPHLPIGRPIANTQIYILDDCLQPVPVGVSAEIYIAGEGVARGYLNLPELTAERFVRNPFSSDPSARMYKTGDLGRWRADGKIDYLGRNDFQVKIRGFRIELGEIETALRACAGVSDAVVRADQHGDDTRLVAYVQGPQQAEAGRLRAALADSLPNYMLPAAFVAVDNWPLTPNGKLDTRALPAPNFSAGNVVEEPVGEIETRLAAIWQSLLHIDGVDRKDDFFAIGGHSLLALRLAVEICKSFNVEFSVNQIFVHAILHRQAASIAGLMELNDATQRLHAQVQESNEGFWL